MTTGRPTYDEAMERAALGCVIREPERMQALATSADPSHFFHPSTRAMFDAMLSIYATGGTIEFRTIGSEMTRLGTLKEIGNPGYITQCADDAPAPSMLDEYLVKLRELADIRFGEGADQPEISEWSAVNLFLSRAPKLRCIGTTWYAYRDGCWAETSRHEFRPIAQEVQPPLKRTERRERAILDHAEGRVQVSKDSLRGFYAKDGEAILINVANGIAKVTAERCELLPHSPDHSFTLKTKASYGPHLGRETPSFAATLSEAMPDSEDRRLFQMFAGSLLLPDARFESALVCYGLAGTGKSTVAEGVAGALGEPLVARLTMKQLCDPKGYHVPSLRFAAVNLGTELDSLEVEDGGAFKALASGEAIQARPIYGSPFVMQTTAKLIFLSNDLPRFKSGTDGELRRMRFIRFDQKPAAPNTRLKEQIASERDGILEWMIEGLMAALDEGAIPQGGETSRAALSRFSISNDPLAGFVTSRCVLGAHYREDKGHLEGAYAEYLEEHGMPIIMQTSFLKRLYERYPQVRAVRNRVAGGERQRAIVGVKLADE